MMIEVNRIVYQRETSEGVEYETETILLNESNIVMVSQTDNGFQQIYLSDGKPPYIYEVVYDI